MVAGDYDDLASLDLAIQGSYGVFFTEASGDLKDRYERELRHVSVLIGACLRHILCE